MTFQTEEESCLGKLQVGVIKTHKRDVPILLISVSK